MGQIGLVEFDGPIGGPLGRELSAALRGRKYHVAALTAHRSILQALQDINDSLDIIYLYVRTPAGHTETYLDQLGTHWRENGPRPIVQCVLENFFGARYHFSLEDRGARVTYVQRWSKEFA